MTKTLRNAHVVFALVLSRSALLLALLLVLACFPMRTFSQALDVGYRYSCAILSTGDVKCWGDSRFGKTGYDTTTDIGDGSGTTMAALGTVNLGAERTATAITARTRHTCAILDTGDVKCWGDSGAGKTGYDTQTHIGCGAGAGCTTMAMLGTVDLGAERTATAITAGGFHTCAILDTENVKCWGDSFAGQTGYDTQTAIGCGGACTTMALLGTVSLGGVLLPVELVAFTVMLDGPDALLAWQTASETNNAGFEIQHRSDGDTQTQADTETWTALGFVEGYGTTEQYHNYLYRVEDLEPGWHVFRFKQIDFDAFSGKGNGEINFFEITASTPLPVELVAFTVMLDGPDALLAWETASETNNAGFEIQHRRDGDTQTQAGAEVWTVLGFVEGYGTTGYVHDYSYRLEDLEPGWHVFRLKQIDFDGAFEYSPEVEVIVGVPGSHQSTAAYPNPFKSQATFTLAIPAEQPVKITLYDALGRRVAVLHEGALTAGTVHRFTVEGSQLTSGLYHIRIEGKYFRDGGTVMLVK